MISMLQAGLFLYFNVINIRLVNAKCELCRPDNPSVYCKLEQYKPCLESSHHYVHTDESKRRRCIYYGKTTGTITQTQRDCSKSKSTILEIRSESFQSKFMAIWRTLINGLDTAWLNLMYFDRYKKIRWKSSLYHTMRYIHNKIEHANSSKCFAIRSDNGNWIGSSCSSFRRHFCMTDARFRYVHPSPGIRIEFDESPNIVHPGSKIKVTCESRVPANYVHSFYIRYYVNSTIQSRFQTMDADSVRQGMSNVTATEWFAMYNGVCTRYLTSKILIDAPNFNKQDDPKANVFCYVRRNNNTYPSVWDPCASSSRRNCVKVLVKKCCKPDTGNGTCSLKQYNPCQGSSNLYVHANETRLRQCLYTKRTRLSTSAARTACNKGKLKLLEIRSESFESNFLAMWRNMTPRPETAWLNLVYNRAAKETRWRGEPDTELKYRHNQIGGASSRYCYAVRSADGQWVYSSCASKRRYFCMTNRSFSYVGPDPYFRTPKFNESPNILHPGSTINVTCESRAPANYVHLFSVKFSSNSTNDYMFVTPTMKSSNSTSLMETKEWFQKIIGNCTRHLTSTIFVTLPISDNQEEIQAELFCFARACGEVYPLSPFTKCESNTEQKCVTFLVTATNQEPELEVVYHAEPNILHIKQEMTVYCRGCVGYTGNFSWELETTEMVVKYQHDDPKISYEIVTQDNTCGTRLLSTLTLKVQSSLADGVISCSSYSPKEANHFSNIKKVSSKPLVVQYGPSKPKIFVEYHFSGHEIVVGWNLTANCTACVGPNGVITWQLVHENGDEESLGDDDYLDANVTQTGSDRDDIQDCGRRVVSTLLLEVEKELNGKVLQCRSFTGPYLPDVDITARSYPLVIQVYKEVDRGFENIDYLLEAIPWMIIILIVTLVTIYIKNTYIPPTRKKKRRRNKLSRQLSQLEKQLSLRKIPLQASTSTNVDTGLPRPLAKSPKEISEKLGLSMKEAEILFKAYKKAAKRRASKKQRSWLGLHTSGSTSATNLGKRLKKGLFSFGQTDPIEARRKARIATARAVVAKMQQKKGVSAEQSSGKSSTSSEVFSEYSDTSSYGERSVRSYGYDHEFYN